MFYYLTDFVWSGGPEDGYFLPRGTEGLSGWTCIDFRPDSTADSGLVVLAVPVRDDAAFGATPIAESTDERIPLAVRRNLGNQFGVTLDSGRLDDTLFELLYSYGDDARYDRWNSLKPNNGGYEILLGNEQILYVPEVSGGASYTESFTKANSSTLGPSQTWTEYGTGDPQVLSNVVAVTTTAAWAWARAAADAASSDNATSVNLILGVNILHGGGGAICRYSGTANTGYEAFRDPNATSALTVGKVVAGTRTVLGTSAFTWALTTYALRVSANGSSVVGSRDSTGTVVRVTDTAITSGTKGGFSIYSNVSNARAYIDDWAFADVTTTAKSLGTVTVATTRTLSRKPAKRLSVTASTLATARKKVGRTVARTATTSATANRKIKRAFSATVSAIETLAAVFVDNALQFTVALSAAVSASFAARRKALARRTVTATLSAGLSRKTKRSVSAAVGSSLLAARRVSKATTTIAAASAAIVRSTTRDVSALAFATLSLARGTRFGRALSFAATTTASGARKASKRVAVTCLTAASAVVLPGLHTFQQVVSATVTTGVTIGKRIAKGLRVALRKVAVFVFDE